MRTVGTVRRAVVFDIDDTLYLERDYVRSGFAAAGAWAHTELGLADLGERAWGIFEDGVRGRIFDEALVACGARADGAVVSRLVDVYRSHVPAIEPPLLPPHEDEGGRGQARGDRLAEERREEEEQGERVVAAGTARGGLPRRGAPGPYSRGGGRFAGSRMLMLTTIGRRSGERRLVPLAYSTEGDRYVVAGSYSGRDVDPAWVANLRANPTATVELGTDAFEAEVTVLDDGPERDRLFAAHVAAMPGFADYQAKTTRTIPMVALARPAG